MEATPTNLSSEEIVRWRGILEKRRHIIMDTDDSIKRHAFTELAGNETGEISKVRLHPADLATDTQTVEVLESLSQRNLKSLKDVDDAIERLEKGQFGKCLSCGEKIPNARLEIIPETRFCVECEQDFEEVKNRFASPETGKTVIQLTELTKAFEALKQLTATDIMQADPITVNITEDLNTAMSLLSDNNIRHLPVIDIKGDIQGIISDRDILNTVLQIKPWKTVEKMRNPYHEIGVVTIMTKTPETVQPDADLQEVSTILLENKISCLPVVDGNHLIGIITEADFVKLLGQGL